MNMGKIISLVWYLSACSVLAVTISKGNTPTGVETAILMLLFSVGLKQQWEDAE